MEYGLGSYGVAGVGWMVGLLAVLWIILMIAAMIALIKHLMGEIADTNHKRRSPLEIARERYALGDIDKSEYDALKKEFK